MLLTDIAGDLGRGLRSPRPCRDCGTEVLLLLAHPEAMVRTYLVDAEPLFRSHPSRHRRVFVYAELPHAIRFPARQPDVEDLELLGRFSLHTCRRDKEADHGR